MRKFKHKPFNREAIWKEIHSRKLKTFAEDDGIEKLFDWALSMVPKDSIVSIRHTSDYWGEWEEYKVNLEIKLSNGVSVIETFTGIASDDPEGGFIVQAINRTPRHLAKVIRKQLKAKLRTTGIDQYINNESIDDYENPSETDFDW